MPPSMPACLMDASHAGALQQSSLQDLTAYAQSELEDAGLCAATPDYQSPQTPLEVLRLEDWLQEAASVPATVSGEKRVFWSEANVLPVDTKAAVVSYMQQTFFHICNLILAEEGVALNLTKGDLAGLPLTGTPHIAQMH